MYPWLSLGPLQGPTYFIILSSVYCFGIYFLSIRAQKMKMSLSHAMDLCLIGMVFGFIGARLFYVFYQEWEYYSAAPLEILKFWKGGFVYYGGFVGGGLACFGFLKFNNLKVGEWADLVAPVLCLCYGIGRLACLAAGCCYGANCDLPWAIQIGDSEVYRHPTQVYAFLYEFLFFIILILLEKRSLLKKKWGQGQLFAFWLVAHGGGRILMEHFRADQRGQFVYSLSISTWISIGLMSLGLYFLFKIKKK